MAIEIVDFPIKHGDFPVRYVSLPEAKHLNLSIITGYKLDYIFYKWGFVNLLVLITSYNW